VVFTDIAGFTQYTAECGDDAAVSLLERQDDLVRRILPSRARVVKELGDGLLLWFDDPAEAIATCLALQELYQHEVLDGTPLWVRMAVHYGMPRQRGHDLIGHDVNLTSRLADLAAPGEVLVSEAAVRACPGFTGVDFDELGPMMVRGVNDPVGVYRVSARTAFK